MLADLLVPARKSCFVVEAIPGQALSAATSTSYCSFVPPCPGTRLTAASATKTPTNIDNLLRLYPLVFEGCGEMLFIVDDCAVSEDVKKWSNALIELAFSGLHKGFSVWLLTQQNTSVAKAFRENVAGVISFYSPSVLDLKTLWDNYSGGLERDQRQQLLSTLKDHRFARPCY